MDIQKIKNTSPKVPELIMQSLLSAMEAGSIQVGDELPPERELSIMLGCGRGSLRECLSILEYLNIIETQGNRKVVIKDAQHFQKAVTFIRISASRNSLQDSLEFRRAVEVAAVRLACERATEEDFARIKATLSRLEKSLYDHKADIDFHQSLTMASHNTVFAATMDLFSSILMEIRLRYHQLPKYYQRTLDSHRAIYEAVRQRDPDQAAMEMEKHLQLVQDFTAEALELGILDE